MSIRTKLIIAAFAMTAVAYLSWRDAPTNAARVASPDPISARVGLDPAPRSPQARSVVPLSEDRAVRERELIAAGPYPEPPVLEVTPEQDAPDAPPEVLAQLAAIRDRAVTATHACDRVTPAATGKLVLAVDIRMLAGDATVTGVEIVESHIDTSIEECVVDAIETSRWSGIGGPDSEFALEIALEADEIG